MQLLLPRSWSIGKRLIFLNTVMICLILMVSGILLDWVLRSDMEQEDKRFLAAEMQSLRILLREYPDDVQTWKAAIERETFASASTYAKYYVRVIDQDGKTIIETTGMPHGAGRPLSPKPNEIPYTSIDYAAFRTGDGKPFLFASAKAREFLNGEKGNIIHIALEMSHETAIISDYRQKVALVIIGGVLFSLLLGMVITKEGLRPLKELMHNVRQITPDRLQVRIGSRTWPKEIAELAQAFDMMLDRLEESFTSLSQFSADLAHELRTPINNLRGEAEVAMSKARTLEEYRQVLSSGLEEYERLSRMIENLLFLARSDSKKQRVNASDLNIRQEIGEVLEYYDAVKEEKNILVAVNGNGNVHADKALFRRVSGNVLSNAFRYTPVGGSITIDIDASSNMVKRITITDTGIGIEPENLPRIFDRFYRTGKARSVHAQGTGLGFSIVKSIMDLHGGSVRVVSGPSPGTIVTLEFPGGNRESAHPPDEKEA